MQRVLAAQVIVHLDRLKVRAGHGKKLFENRQVVCQLGVQPVLHQVAFGHELHHEILEAEEHEADFKERADEHRQPGEQRLVGAVI